MSNIISPQGYHYGEDPESDNPFWVEDGIADQVSKMTATASISNTVGTPSVDVTRSVSGDTVNFDFSFQNLKGDKGDQGVQGIQGEKGEAGADGKSPTVTSTGSTTSGTIAGTITGTDGVVVNVFNGEQGLKGETGADGKSPTVTSTGRTGSSELAGYVTSPDGSEQISIYNGAQGEKGETGAAGKDADTSALVSDVSITNENGVYSVSQTKGGVASDVGSIEVPNIDNVLAEVTDSVVETKSGNYKNDYHTIKETEHNGTQNDVGTFRIARNQITSGGNARFLSSDVDNILNVVQAMSIYNYIDQDGIENSSQYFNITQGINVANDQTGDRAIAFSAAHGENHLAILRIGIQAGDATALNQYAVFPLILDGKTLSGTSWYVYYLDGERPYKHIGKGIFISPDYTYMSDGTSTGGTLNIHLIVSCFPDVVISYYNGDSYVDSTVKDILQLSDVSISTSLTVVGALS